VPSIPNLVAGSIVGVFITVGVLLSSVWGDLAVMSASTADSVSATLAIAKPSEEQA
jgi:hypothetical protein